MTDGNATGPIRSCIQLMRRRGTTLPIFAPRSNPSAPRACETAHAA